MFLATLIIVIVAGIIIGWRAIVGPSVFDRVLAVNAIGGLTVLIIALAGFLTDRPEWLDIALLYALINFIATIAILRYFSYLALLQQKPRTGKAEEPRKQI